MMGRKRDKCVYKRFKKVTLATVVLENFIPVLRTGLA
jgi:hypothetical protein